MRKGKREKAKRAKGEEVNRQEEKGGKGVPGTHVEQSSQLF